MDERLRSNLSANSSKLGKLSANLVYWLEKVTHTHTGNVKRPNLVTQTISRGPKCFFLYQTVIIPFNAVKLGILIFEFMGIVSKNASDVVAHLARSPFQFTGYCLKIDKCDADPEHNFS